jgi:hypothetical protein
MGKSLIKEYCDRLTEEEKETYADLIGEYMEREKNIQESAEKARRSLSKIILFVTRGTLQ